MFTQEEKDLIDQLKAEGRNPREIAGFVGGQRTGRPSTIQREATKFDTPMGKTQLMTDLEEAGKDIKETGQGMFREATSAAKDIGGILTDKDLSFGEKIRGAGSRAFSGGARTLVEEPFKGLVKLGLSQEGEENLKGNIQKFGENIAETEAAKSVVNWYQGQSPDTQREINNALGYAEGLAELVGLGTGIKLTKRGFSKVNDFLGQVDDTIKQVDSGLTPSVAQTDEVVKQVEPPKLEPDDFVDPNLREQARIRMEAEANAPELSFREKAIGLGQSDKAQITGKTDKMQDYIDITKTRNVTKDAPSVMEYGGNQVRNAAEEMEKLLNNTGSRIGQTRQKLSTVKAPIDSVKQIENTFGEQLNSLGLTLNKNGQVVRQKGVVSRVGTPADVKTMQNLWDEFRIVKQSPTLANLIDYRNLVQKNIDFGKSAREVSDALNVPTQRIRAEIKDVADNLVGKSGAEDLKQYTDFINAYNEIKSFTDRSAGGEYLLRVLESGRGGEARQVVNTIKEITGIDLQDDATMMRLVTNLIADADQKTQFTQQITNAGLDTARILGGDKLKLGEKVVEGVMGKITDPEKVLLDATGSFSKGATPSSGNPLTRFKDRIKNTPNKQGGFVKNPLAKGDDTIKVYRGQDHKGFTAFDGAEGKTRFLPDMEGTSFATTRESAENYGKFIIEDDVLKSSILKPTDINPDILADIKKQIKGLDFEDYIEGDGFEDIVSQIAKVAKDKNKQAFKTQDFFPRSKVDPEVRVLSPEALKSSVLSKGDDLISANIDDIIGTRVEYLGDTYTIGGQRGVSGDMFTLLNENGIPVQSALKNQVKIASPAKPKPFPKIKTKDIKTNTLYHGTSADVLPIIKKEGFKFGSELPEDAFRSGGYGAMQDSISFSTDPKQASVFSGQSSRGAVLEVRLKPKAKIVEVDGIEYAEDLNDLIPELKKRNIDGVYIDAEKEVVVFDPKAISLTGKSEVFKPTEGISKSIWKQANK